MVGRFHIDARATQNAFPSSLVVVKIQSSSAKPELEIISSGNQSFTHSTSLLAYNKGKTIDE